MVCACASIEFSRSSLTAEVRDVRTWPDVRDVIEEGGRERIIFFGGLM